MAQLSISGAVSNLDTAAIVNQLVSVQGAQQALLRTQQGAAQKAADALKSLSGGVANLGTLARDLAATSAWQGTTASSSSPTVTATASGTRATSLTFDVTSVAAAHALVSSNAVASTSTVVASGPVTLTRHDGSTRSIQVGTGSLAQVVDAINASEEGLLAIAVQTAPGQYRLQVTATATGAASDFDLTGLDGFAGVDVLTTGTDATVRIGTDPATAYDVTSSTNTFADLVPGLRFTVSAPATGVTVASTVDGAAVADKVGKLVDAANTLLSDLRTKTSYDSATKTAGPLLSESAARSLQQAILATVGEGGAAGISLTKTGTLAFDRQRFLSAFAADPAAVARGYGASTTFAPGTGVVSPVTLVRAGDSARAGSYAVQVTTAATREQWRLDPAGGVIAGATVTITRGSTVVSHTAGGSDTLADAALALSQKAQEAGLGIGVGVSGASLLLTAESPGSAAGFTTTLGGAAGTQVTDGVDVAGFIDGEAATGSGTVLSLLTGTGGAVGLAISVPVSSAEVTSSGGAVGTLTYAPGLAQRLVTLVDDATGGPSGLLSSARDGRLAAVKDYQQQIDRWDDRLTAYRELLTRQFTAMETALAALKSQTGFLTGLSTSTGTS